jgi:hypothetical protein
MNTRDFILVGAGALVGYLLVGVMNRDKIIMEMEEGVDNLLDILPETSASQTLPPETSASQTLPPATAGNTTSGTTQIIEPEVVETMVDPKVSYCEDNWTRYAMTMRFGSEEEMQRVRNNFIENCLTTMTR